MSSRNSVCPQPSTTSITLQGVWGTGGRRDGRGQGQENADPALRETEPGLTIKACCSRTYPYHPRYYPYHARHHPLSRLAVLGPSCLN